MGSVNFQIEGEFVCDLARSWFWDEGREYAKCEELLLSCLVTDQINLEEKKKIVVEILEGRKKLVGVNSLSLVDDNARIRPLTDKIEEYRKKEIIRQIEEDIQRRPLAYLDPYSCEQNPSDYRPTSGDLNYDDERDIRDAYGKYLTPYEELRLWAYSVDSYFYGRRVLPGFWNESERPYLDQGFYLIERPALVYKLIGGPVKDTDKLLLLFRDYLQSLVDRQVIEDSPETITIICQCLSRGRLLTYKPGPAVQSNRIPDPDMDVLIRSRSQEGRGARRNSCPPNRPTISILHTASNISRMRPEYPFHHHNSDRRLSVYNLTDSVHMNTDPDKPVAGAECLLRSAE